MWVDADEAPLPHPTEWHDESSRFWGRARGELHANILLATRACPDDDDDDDPWADADLLYYPRGAPPRSCCLPTPLTIASIAAFATEVLTEPFRL